MQEEVKPFGQVTSKKKNPRSEADAIFPGKNLFRDPSRSSTLAIPSSTTSASEIGVGVGLEASHEDEHSVPEGDAARPDLEKMKQLLELEVHGDTASDSTPHFSKTQALFMQFASTDTGRFVLGQIQQVQQNGQQLTAIPGVLSQAAVVKLAAIQESVVTAKQAFDAKNQELQDSQVAESTTGAIMLRLQDSAARSGMAYRQEVGAETNLEALGLRAMNTAVKWQLWAVDTIDTIWPSRGDSGDKASDESENDASKLDRNFG